MIARPIGTVRGYVTVLAALVLCLFILFPQTPPTLQFQLNSLSLDPSSLRNGDLIFRRVDGPTRRFISGLGADDVYSHVGLVQVHAGQVSVIHVTPGDDLAASVVRAETVESFVAIADAVGVYRLSQPDATAEKAVYFALEWIDQIQFDFEFDLTTADRLYCTEMVWLAYERAGLDLVDGEFDHVDLPFLPSEQALLPSRLASSPHLDIVVSVP